MRIAIYAATFVPNKDGVAKTIHELINYLDAKGHEYAIWSSDVPEEVAKGYDVKRTHSLPIFAYPSYRFGFYRPSINNELKEFSPDIIHISTPDVSGLGFLRYGKKHNVPVSSVFHTDFPSYMKFYHLGFLEPLSWIYLRSFYNSCDVVLAPTKEVRSRLKMAGIRNVNIWGRGIHTNRYNPSKRSLQFRTKYGISNETVFLFSGRLVQYKGLDVLVSVYKRLMENNGRSVRFLILGSGPEEKELKMNMPKAIFPGYLVGEELYQAYASSDIFLFPSTTETFGNVILEAMASGLPCIVSDKGGCKELVKESNGGLISKSNDIESYMTNCRILLKDLKLREELRNNALNFATSMSWTMINDGLLDIYKKVIEDKRRL